MVITYKYGTEEGLLNQEAGKHAIDDDTLLRTQNLTDFEYFVNIVKHIKSVLFIP